MVVLHTIATLVSVAASPPIGTTSTDTLRHRPDPPRWTGDTTVVEAPEGFLEALTEEAVSADPVDVLEFLEALAENPIDANTATRADLAAIPALSPRLAAVIIAHREQYGPFSSITDLATVDGFTDDVLREAGPYLAVEPVVEAAAPPGRFPAIPRPSDVRRQLRIDILQRMQQRLDLPRGYEPVADSVVGTQDEPRRYLGSPVRIYTRVRAMHRRTLSTNLTLEKDPGEPFTWDPENGFYGYDFVSFHAAAMRVGRIDALVLGDFVAEFGQGVALWRASGFGKGREPVRQLVRTGRGIRPYASTDENRFFRGAAATVAISPRVYATAFGSRRRYDARFAEVDTSEARVAESGIAVAGMPATGLHRTRAEIAQKHALGQTLAGGGVELRLRRATAGVVGYHARFDEPLARGERPYQRFNLEGREATMVSLYGNLSVGPYFLFGEVARSPGGALGGIGGIEGTLGPLDALLLGRHYPRDFNSLHGYGFGERNGVTQNETGIYLGLGMRPTARWTLSGYFDQFRAPWLRFAVPRPGTGHDALIFLEHRPRQWLSAYVLARTKTREVGTRVPTETGGELEALEGETRRSVRFQGEYWASRDIRFRGRIEWSRYRRSAGPVETGVVVFHDLRWTLRRRLVIDTRVTYFDTDGFNARLYQFENDLLGVMSNALLYGRGTRAYVLFTVRPGGRLDGLDVRLKFAATSYRDRDAIGSGLDQIEGHRVRDLGLQMRYRF